LQFFFIYFVIRPVLEYSAPVWHYALTKEQTHQIEKNTKNVPFASSSTFLMVCRTLPCYILQNLNTLASRRHDLCQKFFIGITQPSSCLHHLLLPTKHQSVISRLGTSAKFPKVYTRTERYCSFIDYALNNYQGKI